MIVIEEGTWFAVPLRSKGFAVGLVARSSPDGGVVLAHFFKGVWDEVPSIQEIRAFKPADVARVLRVGDLGLIDGSWPIVGRDPEWRREDWTVPCFVRRDDLSRRAWSVKYSDRDANLVESESPTSYDTTLERDALLGAGATEVVLTRLLS
jgi:hypothetical protein